MGRVAHPLIVIERDAAARGMIARRLGACGTNVIEVATAREALEQMVLGIRPCAVVVGSEDGGERMLRALERGGIPLVRLVDSGSLFVTPEDVESAVTRARTELGPDILRALNT